MNTEYKIKCDVCGHVKTAGYSVGRFTLCHTHSRLFDRYQKLFSELTYLRRSMAPLWQKKR
jgi:hypothetical protein